jgi:hypothetical protein
MRFTQSSAAIDLHILCHVKVRSSQALWQQLTHIEGRVQQGT